MTTDYNRCPRCRAPFPHFYLPQGCDVHVFCDRCGYTTVPTIPLKEP